MDRAMTHLSRNLLRNGCSSRVPSATMEVPFAPAAAASATFAGPATTRATTTMMLVELLLKLMLLRSTTACTVAPRNEAQLLPLGTQDLARDLHIFGQLLSAEGLRDLVHTSPELAPEKECPSEVLQGLALIPKEVQGDDPMQARGSMNIGKMAAVCDGSSLQGDADMKPLGKSLTLSKSFSNTEAREASVNWRSARFK
eukprot:CAMPEP_0115563608 /NCGR_PEP_ID=MMETSP0271-20121206/102125_1 /TAXON_ID=71861 /ORGANISM="Scrippsiella trochoidea, Strain CCMP3099" /LENGTH=198 /DNA_ID=CAMNT_0002997827 /DNA_START=32 /DNA_END=626 /DNA_ORIENTATION=+